MKNSFYQISIVILLASVFFSSCTTKIKGEGPIVTQEFTHSTIKSLRAQTSCEFVISYGEEQRIVIEGQQNIIDRVEQNVNNEFLEVNLKNGNYSDYHLKVFLTLPIIETVDLSGSGAIEIGGFSNLSSLNLELSGSGRIYTTGLLEVKSRATVDLGGSGNIEANIISADLVSSIDGSGNIDLTGSSNTHSSSIKGSGNINSFALATLSSVCNISGSGNASLAVQDDLRAIISGSGNINYKGTPSVNSTITGSGSVSQY